MKTHSRFISSDGGLLEELKGSRKAQESPAPRLHGDLPLKMHGLLVRMATQLSAVLPLDFLVSLCFLPLPWNSYFSMGSSALCWDAHLPPHGFCCFMASVSCFLLYIYIYIGSTATAPSELLSLCLLMEGWMARGQPMPAFYSFS